jgi:hypothetical protein
MVYEHSQWSINDSDHGFTAWYGCTEPYDRASAEDINEKSKKDPDRPGCAAFADFFLVPNRLHGQSLIGACVVGELVGQRTLTPVVGSHYDARFAAFDR